MEGKADPYQMSFADDCVILYQKGLTEAVHEADPTIKIFAQISHAGMNTLEYITGQELVSASAIRLKGTSSRALTISEIHALEDEFAAASLRGKQSGYDGVELHSAHGYLLNQFYSPLTNFRNDAYGPQSMENRLRFLTETIGKVRQAVGDEFPIAVRLGASDYRKGGSTIEDAVRAADLLAKEKIDLLDISGGFNCYTREGHSEPGWFSDMSSAIKEKVKIPILLTGGIKTPAQAQALLDIYKADLVGVGRVMIRDPEWGSE